MKTKNTNFIRTNNIMIIGIRCTENIECYTQETKMYNN